MTDSSATALKYMVESAWGTIPATALKHLRFTGEGLAFTGEMRSSNEIRADGQVTKQVRVATGAEGPVNFELSYGAHDDLLEVLLRNDWTDAVNISDANIWFIASDQSLNCLESPGLNSVGIVVGQWLLIAGATNAVNNGYKRVATVTADKITFDRGATIIDEGDTPTRTITVKSSGFLKNGTTKKSVVYEKEFGEITEFMAYTGMRINEGSLSIAVGEIITGSFGHMGKVAIAAGATVGTGAEVEAPTDDVMNAVDNIADVYEGGVVSTLDLTNITFTVRNNARIQRKVSSAAPRGIGLGRFVASGSFTAYFETRAIYEKFLSFTKTNLAFRTVDGDGNSYVWDIPRIALSNGKVEVGGNDQDVMASFDFAAERDPTTGFTLAISRLEA